MTAIKMLLRKTAEIGISGQTGDEAKVNPAVGHLKLMSERVTRNTINGGLDPVPDRGPTNTTKSRRRTLKSTNLIITINESQEIDPAHLQHSPWHMICRQTLRIVHNQCYCCLALSLTCTLPHTCKSIQQLCTS